MPGADDYSGEPRRVEQPLLLVEIPAARLLGEEPALKAVGQAGDHILKTAHLLVEICPEPPELLLVAQLLGLDDLIEARRERLVVGLRCKLPIAAAGRGKHALAQILAGGRFLLARFIF